MIEAIIEILTDDKQSLTSALLKTQVLASRLENEKLKTWVTKELQGYKISEDIPDYRLVKANPRADIDDGQNYQANSPLPVTIFSKSVTDVLVKFRITNGVQSLEQTVGDDYGDYLKKEFGDDFGLFLTRDAQKNGHAIRISSVKIITHISEVSQVLGEIRTRLLELMLEVEKQYPTLEIDLKKGEIDKKQVNQTIVQIMNQTNITTTGDSNVITIGNNNTITVKTKIDKGDTKALTKALEELQISKSDIAEVIEIVKDDTPDTETKTLGTKTRTWISKMLNKTLDGTWQIATGAAGGLLVELFKYFYGIQ